MLISLALAVLILGLCMGAGRVVLHALGASRPTWLAGAVGFAALIIAAGLLVRLPGRAASAAVVIGLLLGAGLVASRRSLRPAAGQGPRAAGAPHAAGFAVVAIVLAAAAVPFLLEGRAGILGEGIYTNDHAAQLYWTDWLQNGFGPEPNAVAWGYPVGPQSLAAVIAEATGASLVEAFNGLLLAIPALTALAALALVGTLRPAPRIATAALAGLPFLGASFLAQSAFKETAMALFVLAFAATLALATEAEQSGSPVLGRRAAAGSGALLALAGVFAYSVPALAWFALILAGWLMLTVVAGESRIDWGALREALWRRRVPLALVAIALVGIAALIAGRVGDFVERIGDVSTSTGRLSSPVFPGEVFGIWPEGDFRVVRGEVEGALLATAIGAAGVIAGAMVLLQRRSYAILAALGAAVAIYAGAYAFASIYVEAKALAVMAPVVVVAALGGLFAAPVGRGGRLLSILGVVFALGASVSTFLALREAPVGFSDRGRELEELAERVKGDSVAFLGVDRFAAYWLRGTLVKSPGGYVPAEVRARPEKIWQQGLAMDLDTLSASGLDDFDYAITTTAAYQSSPPPNMEEVARTESYALWERTARTPRTQVLKEGGAPGAVLEASESPFVSLACRLGSRAPGEGVATVLPEPVVGGPGGWSRPVPFEAPGTARQPLELTPGRWQLSMQYHSQVDLEVVAGGLKDSQADLEVASARLEAELPASLVGMYLTHQGQGAFWPVGEIEVFFTEDGKAAPVEVEVTASEPGALERVAGATRRVWLGKVAATRLDPLAEKPGAVALGEACNRYVDRYDPR